MSAGFGTRLKEALFTARGGARSGIEYGTLQRLTTELEPLIPLLDGEMCDGGFVGPNVAFPQECPGCLLCFRKRLEADR